MQNQKLIFRPSWISRLFPVVFEMIPTEPVPIVESGSAKLGWFRMLKNSARNSIFTLSTIEKRLIRELSRSTKLGPGMMFRPEFPKRGVPLARAVRSEERRGGEQGRSR